MATLQRQPTHPGEILRKELSDEQMEKMIPESDEDSTASKYMDYFGDTLYQELAEDVTESNNGEGIGIAKTLYEQMKRNYGLE